MLDSVSAAVVAYQFIFLPKEGETMHPGYCNSIPSYMRDGACSIANAGRDGRLKTDISRPSIYSAQSKAPRTIKSSNIKDYTPGVTIP